MQDPSPTLQRLQLDAYRAVLRAMAVAPLQYVRLRLHALLPRVNAPHIAYNSFALAPQTATDLLVDA